MNILYKTKKFLMLLTAVSGVALIQSCTEEIDTSSRYTFKDPTIISYLRSFPETYSEYCDLLDSVNVSDFSDSKMSLLLSARGHYTCFAPTNEAIQKYLEHLVDSGVISEPSWDAPEFQEINPGSNTRELLLDTRKLIVFNSLIDGGDNIEAYSTGDFSIRAEKGTTLGKPNMFDRKLRITKGNGTKYAVHYCNISDTNCDINTINGRIHQIDQVIAPSTQTTAEYFDETIKKKTYGYYSTAVMIKACGLSELLAKDEDKEYYRKYMAGNLENLTAHPTYFGKPGALPERRYYGYTIFTEGDAWWENALGLTEKTITEMDEDELVKMIAQYVVDNGYHLASATTDDNYTDKNNALNQFVTYHIIDGKLEPDKLVIHYNELWYNHTDRVKLSSVADYYTTIGRRRLVKTYEASRTCDGKRNVIYLNRFPNLKNGRNENYTELSCDDAKKGVEVFTVGTPDIGNAYLYKLSDVLYFNEETAGNLGSERIRFDVTTMLPEFLSNDIRCNETQDDAHKCVGIPESEQYQYLENCVIGNGTRFYYLTGRHEGWTSYQGDELNIVGNYEVTFKLPPVPRDGVYEIRMGLNVNSMRGMCQVYWGSDKNALPVAGIPVDMRMGGVNWEIKGVGNLPSVVGWEQDAEDDDDLNAEIDKRMRNNWYMKAPNIYYSAYTGGKPTRSQPRNLRKILVREEMKADVDYYIRFRSVLEDTDTEFSFDYMELCPKEVFDNPETPEDIW